MCVSACRQCVSVSQTVYGRHLSLTLPGSEPHRPPPSSSPLSSSSLNCKCPGVDTNKTPPRSVWSEVGSQKPRSVGTRFGSDDISGLHLKSVLHHFSLLRQNRFRRALWCVVMVTVFTCRYTVPAVTRVHCVELVRRVAGRP